MIWFIITLLLLLAFERFYLRGPRPADYPVPAEPGAVSSFGSTAHEQPDFKAVTRQVESLSGEIAAHLRRHNFAAARELMDRLGEDRRYSSRFHRTEADGVAAEWVLAPGADPLRRALYIHGGGFVMGSTRSHRTITSKFSDVCGCAVLAIDYRLLPENRFTDAVTDCRNAYRWMLENGPAGAGEAQRAFVAGDSAGGTLALSLSAWLRDRGLRLPDAVVAMSPLTDSTFSGASICENLATDVMLAPALRPLVRLPPFLRSLSIVWAYRVRPANPIASPLFDDLSGLPPTLVQASEAEMLLDDARRYVYKARAAGTPARLQTWAGMFHVFQIFERELPQARDAWTKISQFIKQQAAEAPAQRERG
jgi:acetyl esterase/lipase